MRRVLCFALLIALLAPVAAPPPAAQAGEVAPQLRYIGRGECKRLTRMIARYGDVADMARAREDRMWEEHTMRHIGRLSERRALGCPGYAKKPAGAQLVAMLRDAAKIAYKLFMLGLI